MRFLLPPLALLLACSGKGSTGPGENATVVGDISTVSARISTGIRTVVIVDWTSPETAESAWIEYGADDTYGQVAPARDFDGTEAAGLILGTPESTEIHFRVVAQVSDGQYVSEDQTISTGALPDDLVIPVLTDNAPDEPWGNFLLAGLANMNGNGTGSFITNRAGEIVWYIPTQDGMVLASRVSRDGRAVLYQWVENINATETSKICRFDLDGEHETCFATPEGHHDFIEERDGTFTYPIEVSEHYRDYDLVSNNLVNRADDGEQTVLWSAFDDVPLVPTADWDRGGSTAGYDWIHINGIWHDEEGGFYYLSSFTQKDIRKVPEAGGASEWALGGEFNDFTFDGQEFGTQHAPQKIDGGLILFDNAAQGTPSRVVSFMLNEDRMTATQELSFSSEAAAHATVMGDAHLLPNGYIASAFGDAGAIIVWSPEGEDLWDLTFPRGTIACQVYAYDDLYTMVPN